MSLILEDPKKYKEMADEFQKKDDAVFKNTLAYMHSMSDGDIGEFLEFLGKFFHHVRLNNKMSLRRFCMKYNLDPIIISEIERGLRLPDLTLMDIYLRDTKKDKDETSEVEKSPISD